MAKALILFNDIFCKMSENKINWHTLEKHDTKDIHDGHVNGSLIPVWRNWDKTITVEPPNKKQPNNAKYYSY